MKTKKKVSARDRRNRQPKKPPSLIPSQIPYGDRLKHSQRVTFDLPAYLVVALGECVRRRKAAGKTSLKTRQDIVARGIVLVLTKLKVKL